MTEKLSASSVEELKIPPEKIDIWMPEEYLKRTAFKNEAVKEEIVKESVDRLKVPLKKIKYKKSDKVEVISNKINFNFSYSQIDQIDEKLKSKIDIYAKQKLKESAEAEIEGVSDKFFIIKEPDKSFIIDLNNWKKLDSLIFKVGEEKKDVFDSLPKNSKIFFCPTKEYFSGQTSSDYENECWENEQHAIYIIGDIACPCSIIILMHEMGHIFDMENKKTNKLHSLGLNCHYLTAEIIRRERTASAFAFKVMNPFLKDKQLKQDVINYLKNYALSSYNYEAIKNFEEDEKLKPERERFADAIRHTTSDYDSETERQEMETQTLIGNFIKWQKINAYKQWRSKKENKELDEFDEFGVWQSWIEKTNYDYLKDLGGGKANNKNKTVLSDLKIRL
ncbi:MAG: hypothetical protein V1649_00360 [Patescibacteria group bacterium]